MKFSKQLQTLINSAIQDCELDDNEKTVLLKRAQSEGISPDEFEVYINSLLNRKKKEEEEMMLWKKRMEEEKKKKKRYQIGIAVFIFFIIAAVLAANLYDDMKERKEANENYGWSYEKACENEDFEVAHNILRKLEKDVIEEKNNEKYHQVKGKTKKHWFKDDEYVVDQNSAADHRAFVEGLRDKARIYLEGLYFVYNAEIAIVKETSEDDCSKKVKHLLSELKTKLSLFKSLNMEDEAQRVYFNLAFANNLKVSPEKTNISGPLNSFFEVVNREYVISKNEYGQNFTITIDFKRKNKKGNYSEKTIRLRLMDKNKNIVCSDDHTIYDDSPLHFLRVGEIGSVQFVVDNVGDITSFVVESGD